MSLEDEIIEIMALGMANANRISRAYHPVEELAKLKSADVWRRDARNAYAALRDKGIFMMRAREKQKERV